MRNLLIVTALCLAGASAAARAADEPLWAWGFTKPADDSVAAPAASPAPALDNAKPLSVAGSSFTFTRAQIIDFFGPADWFPGDHPQMPDIVAHGRKSASPPVYACALCHLPNGRGRPENANVTGLSDAYIVQQLMDFRSGARKTSDKRKTNTALMAGFAKNLTDEEIKFVAAYFAAIPATQWTRVVESDTAPKTKSVGGLFIPLEGAEAGAEPLGNRIVETPENAEQTETLRNPHVGFVAYVPRGSIKKGEALVRTGAGKVTACTACHGADLRGLGPVPRLAGRSPSYIARQIYDMQTGNRAGAWTPLMAPVVAKLSADDVVIAAAYLASLPP